MTHRTSILLFVFVLPLVVSALGPATADAGPRRRIAGPRVDAPPHRQSMRVAQRNPDRRERVRQRIRAMRAWRLTEALNLDEQTAAKLFPILNDYDDRFLKLARTNAATRQQLAEALEQRPPNNTLLDKLIDRLEAQQRSHDDLQRDRFRAVRKVLTPVQSAQIVVLLPELDRKIRREIRRAMDGRRGKRGQRRNRDRAGDADATKNPFRD